MPTEKSTINWYNKNATGYVAHVRNTNESIYHSLYEKPAMYGLVPNLRGKKVISLGCGSGEDSIHLKKRGAKESIGIDISTELIKIAQKSYPTCSFYVMNMEKLKFSNNTLDFAYSSLAIHYLENWTPVFKEVYRVLKPNSYFLFSCGHPTRTAMASFNNKTEESSKLETTKNKISGKVKIVGSYLDRKKLSGGFGKNTVTTWRKSFSEISSEILSAGFLIERIEEPRPLKKMETLSPQTYKKLNKIPEFVIFRLFKPSN